MKNIPITKPCFDERELELIAKPIESGWVVQGPYVAEFEKLFCGFTGCAHAVATSNCTTALHLGLEIFGVKPGDKVVVPALTYVACANVVDQLGAEVVFCDVDLNTFNLDPECLAAILQKDHEKKIKVVMPVDLFGLCADYDRILPLVKNHGARVLEDAACAFGSFLHGRHAGHFGDIGCFSFHPRKAITTGEGGMLVTANADHDRLARMLRDHGAEVSDHARHDNRSSFLLPEFPVRGYNYRMTDLQGALGVAQMEKAKSILTGRKRVAQKYLKELCDVSFLKLPVELKKFEHSYQSFVCLFTGGLSVSQLGVEQISGLHAKRGHFMEYLLSCGLGVRPGTHAPYLTAYYQNKYHHSTNEFPMAFVADQLSLALPVYAQMTPDEQDYVIQCIKDYKI